MQRFLSGDLWDVLAARAKRAARRRVAVAYVTRDHLGMRQGDLLIVDASRKAIACGETSAKLLRELHRKGVEIYSVPGLHAKVVLLDELAFVGSANLSDSSRNALVEAGVLTDSADVVTGVQVALSNWISGRRRLSKAHIDELVTIPVSRRRGPAHRSGRRSVRSAVAGNNVWIVGVRDLPKDAFPKEQARIERGEAKAAAESSRPSAERSWIRWAGKKGFGVKCRQGDWVVQILPGKGGRIDVLRPDVVQRVDVEPTCRRIYLEEIPGRLIDEMSLAAFQRLLKAGGVGRRVGPGSNRVVEMDRESMKALWKRKSR